MINWTKHYTAFLYLLIIVGLSVLHNIPTLANPCGVRTDSVATALTTESITAYAATDSIATAATDSTAVTTLAADPTHRVRPAEWIVPGAVAVTGALLTNEKWGKKFRHWVQGGVSKNGEHQIWADNYLPYVPAVTVYALDLCGVKAQHGLADRTILLAMSMATMFAVTNVAKHAFGEMRPDGSERNSFPSGHTATSFVCAEFLWQEYRSTKPWIGYAGYALALGVGYLRIHNHCHWVNDVLAGAAVGMLSTKFAYWLYPKIFKKHRQGNGITAFGLPYYNGSAAGVSLALNF